LDELRLEEKLPFEKEGPDGTGKHVNFINVLKGDSIFIKSFGQSALFQLDGGLVKRIDWVKRYDIDANKSYQNFVLMFGNTFLDPTIHLMSENDFILVSHQFSNEIYVFNLNGEPTKTVTYEPKMTPKRAKDLGGKGIISQTIIKLGIIINDYPNDIPFPSCLMSGYISNRPIHIVIGINQKDCVIITAYEPDPHLWDKDFKIKIK
jgi:hypothetical protein